MISLSHINERNVISVIKFMFAPKPYYLQRLGKACHLVDLANSDARLKKIMYPKLGLNLATVESRPNSL